MGNKRGAGAADLIVTGGRIWSGGGRPPADAIAVNGGKIAAVGRASDVAHLYGRQTEVIHLNGRCVVPGFNDAHVHFSMGGFSLTSVQLRSCRNEGEFRDAIARFAASQPRGEWILHGEWDPERWPSATLPSAQTIDGVTPDHPVFVRRIDAHTSLANSLAMRLAGVDENTADVPGGVIERYDDGRPTGIFKDAAKRLIERAIPCPSRSRMADALKAAQRHALRHGITSIHDMGIVGGTEAERRILLQAYQDMYQRGDLRVRTSLHTPLTAWREPATLGIMAGFGNAELRIGALKGFADGSLGSRTAWFDEPYMDSPQNCGTPMDDFTYETMRDADNARLQLAIHAIGDRANGMVLDFFDRLNQDNGQRDRRARIEHAQHLRAEDFARFKHIGVIASVQPFHCADDGTWLERSIGPDRAARSYAFRSLLDAGAILAFGSDWPVEPIDPLAILSAAVTRRTIDGKHPQGWYPAEKITLGEALMAYTFGSAHASFEEDMKGTLEPGKVADFVVLSRDIFSEEPSHIERTAVDCTVAGGQVAYAAQGDVTR